MMNKTIILLLFSIYSFSQNKLNSNFSVEKNKIVWSKTFTSNEDPLLQLKKNLSLTFTDSMYGSAENHNLRCKGIAVYARENFKFIFIIEQLNGSYKVTASNFIFGSSLNFNFGAVSTNETPDSIESFELKSKDNTIRTNQQSTKNLNCLDEYLTSLFKI